MRGRQWAYPVSITAFAAFVAYQLNRFALTGSPGLMVLSVFDMILIALIAREWRQSAIAARPAQVGETAIRRTADEIPAASRTPSPLAAISAASRARPTSG